MTGVEQLDNQRRSVVADGRTYNTYGPDGGMGVGVPVQARKESVQIHKVHREELADIYVNYANAALLEKYRWQKHARSLRGICMFKDPIKQEQKKDKDHSKMVEQVGEDLKNVKLETKTP